MVSQSRQFESSGIAITGPIRRWVSATVYVGMAAFAPFVSSHGPQGFLVLAVFFGLGMGVTYWSAWRRPGTVWVERGGIGIRRSGTMRHYRLCEPRQAWITDAGEPHRVTMHLTRGRIIEIDVAPEQGAELLHVAGVDIERRRVRFPLARADAWYPPRRWRLAASKSLLRLVASFIGALIPSKHGQRSGVPQLDKQECMIHIHDK